MPKEDRCSSPRSPSDLLIGKQIPIHVNESISFLYGLKNSYYVSSTVEQTLYRVYDLLLKYLSELSIIILFILMRK